jgi:hypothetical protein
MHRLVQVQRLQLSLTSISPTMRPANFSPYSPRHPVCPRQQPMETSVSNEPVFTSTTASFAKKPSQRSTPSAVELLKVFLTDLAGPKVHPCPQALSLAQEDFDKKGAMLRSNRASSLLLAREMVGHRGYGSMRRPYSRPK